MVTPSGWFPSAGNVLLLMPMNDGWHCLASDDVRLSHDLSCSLGHDVQICQQSFHTGYMYRTVIYMGAPTLRPIAMVVRMASSKMRRPSDETGGALSHAPDSLEQAPKKPTRDDWSVQWAKRESNRWWTTGCRSQDFCWCLAVGRGTVYPWACACKASFHVDKARSLSSCEAALTNGWVGVQ